MATGKIIGILGGIGAGKSTVAAEFARQGCAVIDADAIGHEVLKEPAVSRRLIDAFGPDIMDSTGGIDRTILGEKAFQNPESVAQINRILHPVILERCQQQMSEFQNKTGVRAIVLDAPLLLETGLDKRCDILIFVEADPTAPDRRCRRQSREFLARIKKRENFQISLDKKRKIADYIIENNSGFSALAGQVARILLEL
ncbi:MAG: dephospho-CoA kinase [Sedimentisphaerales bacterium]|nr:dephospho-CoA kinase [Sedimentisphaerales bacterium]